LKGRNAGVKIILKSKFDYFISDRPFCIYFITNKRAITVDRVVY